MIGHITTYKLLLVEDDAGDAFLVKEMLTGATTARFDLVHVDRLATAVDLLATESFDVILEDLALPDAKGLDIIDMLCKKAPHVPIVVMSGQSDEELSIAAVQKGAQDYLVKGHVDTHLLVRSVRYAVERKHAEEEAAINHQVISALYTVSAVCSRSLNLNELLSDVLDVMTGISLLNVERKACFFLVEGDRMELASHVGCSDEFSALHQALRVGTCLCGLAAQTGQIVTSQDCDQDERHTICCSGMKSHGHIILPIKSRGKVLGVLCLYSAMTFSLDDRIQQMLTSLGDQIGISVENALLYKHTEDLALHDPLTGLANRRYMELLFDKAFAGAKRGMPLSVIMFDIDNFKKYNDTYGHAAGDAILQSVAQAVSRETRLNNLVARYGGEEFVILLSDTGLTETTTVAERIRSRVEADVGITVSLGVASYDHRITTKEDLICKADEALYRAKQNGRNRVEIG